MSLLANCLLGCADPIFPGMYSRISSQYQWIRNLVCTLAENPPAYFQCPPRLSNGDKQTRPVTIELLLDRFPIETGWLIRDQYGKTNAYVGIGEYEDVGNKLVITTVMLKEDTKYEFIMLDSYGDGLKFDGGNYKVWLGPDPFEGIQVVSGNTFGKQIIHNFYLPKAKATDAPVASPPTNSDVTPPSSTPSLAPQVAPDEPHITIGFKFDSFAEETGWAVTSVETQELLISKPFGTYSGKDNSMVFETVPLPTEPTNANDHYIFAILDSGRNGLCCEEGQGFFQVFFGDMADDKVMFRGGNFKYLQQFMFDLNGGIITSPPVAQRVNKPNKGGGNENLGQNVNDTSSARASYLYHMCNTIIFVVTVVLIL
jgi:hypothetical protein